AAPAAPGAPPGPAAGGRGLTPAPARRAPPPPPATLSGGERFRAALAALLLAEPAPQLLMLDEPTNNLDLSSVRQLTEALESYEGALVVASHDVPFLESIGITRWLLLDGELRPTTAEAVRETLWHE
ncbi:AAA family ATPase, partial [Streptomyces sp. NPDC059552]|uniref:AAA family ATPase n=1 Tax=Streptomyces sp. NPDC059552 TaxID=3346862 RepID=UPI0036C6565C